ncbi:MAG TPA: penicillin acylase family protein, partial [Trueperaceae bacterium]|nr:penicillin acylase family protein [Trueperaceae bacterium]
MRWIKGILILLVILFLALAAGFIYLRQSLPKVSGNIEIKGITDSVEIIRDKNAVPHIYAKNQADALFALGYVHAQDRLWQMEFQRRVGAGRLSEFAGKSTIGKDKFLRTISVYKYAKEAIKNLEPETIAALDSYIAGINSYIDTRKGPLPPEFLFFKIKPEPWKKEDVVVWAKMMAWDLGANWSDEILRARLSTELSTEQIEELFPAYPNDAPVALPDLKVLYKDINMDDLTAGLYQPKPPGLGSNNWVLSGDKTDTGKPMLANDPHLALNAPALWYFAHISAPGLEAIGATLPGTPTILLGRNENIAWGFTNTGPDVQDLFIEKINPDNPNQYLSPSGNQDFITREEVIKVKGGDDVTITVRESRHGPIISDVSSKAKGIA